MECRRSLLGFVLPLLLGGVMTPSAREKGESRPSFRDTELINDFRGRGGLSADGVRLRIGLLATDISGDFSISFSLVFIFTSSILRSSFSLRKLESSSEIGRISVEYTFTLEGREEESPPIRLPFMTSLRRCCS